MQLPNLSLSDSTPMSCDECGHEIFIQGVMLRKFSPLLTGQSKPAIQPIPVFACQKCGHVNDEFKPTEIRSLE